MIKSIIYNSLNFITLFTIFTFLVLVISNGIYNKKTKYFLFLLIDCFLFTLFFTIENLSLDLNLAIVFAKLTFFTLSFFPVLFLLLTLQVVGQNKSKLIDSWFQYLLFIPSFFFIIMVLIKKYSLNITPVNDGYYIKIVSFSPFFVLFNFIYEIVSIIFLFYAIKENKENNLQIRELIFLFIGFVIPVIYMVIMAILQLAGLKNPYPFEIWFLLFSGLFLFYGVSRYGIILGTVFNKKIFSSSALMIAGINLSGEIFEANESFLKIFNLKRKEIIGKQLNDLSEKSKNFFDGFDYIFQYIDSIIKNEKTSKSESDSIFEVIDKIKNSTKYYELNINPIITKNVLFGHIFILNEVTLRKNAEDLLLKKQRLLEAIVKSLDELLTNSDLNQAIINALKKIGTETQVDRVYIFENYEDPFTGKIFTSQKFEWTNGIASPQIDNPELSNIEFEEFFPEMFMELSNNRQFSGLIKDFPQNLKAHFENQDIISILTVPIFVDNKFWGFIGLDECKDSRLWAYDEILTLKAAAEVIGDAITHRRMSDTIKQLAYYDIITGLPNRALFYERLKLSIEISKRNKKLLGIILMDFDKFKDINDTYGHDTGDELLKVFSERILKILRKTDTISRFGGDEFVLLLTDINFENDIKKILIKILDCFEKPFIVKNYSLIIKSSLGIAIYPKDGTKIVDLIKNADIAMYEAKKHGGNNYHYFSNILEV